MNEHDDAQKTDTINVTNKDTNNNSEKRKRKNDTMSVNSQSKYLKSNYYSVLDIEKDTQCDEQILQEFEKHVKEYKEKELRFEKQTNNQNKTKSTSNASTTMSQTQISDNVKIPPINLIDMETKELIKFVKNGLKINDFRIKEFRNKKSLFMNNLKDYARVKTYLEKSTAKFFTFTPKSEKTKTYLLKGLSGDTQIEDILHELNKYQEDDLKFIKVSQFTTKKSKEKGYLLPMFLVQISSNSSINKLKQIKTLLYHCIRWEQLKHPEIPQCRNCQGFFHSASNCYLPPKCVKCDKQHERGKCSIDKVSADERDKLYCVLCKKHGHPASYKGCDIYRSLQTKLRNKKQNNLTNNVNVSNFNVEAGLSYADKVKGNNTTSNQLNSNHISGNSFLEEIKNIMLNLTTQVVNLQKQLQLQISRVDTLFSIIEV